jgi:hypothetical protein
MRAGFPQLQSTGEPDLIGKVGIETLLNGSRR